MTEYDNRNSGALFKNDRKESEKQPDYTGSWQDGNGNEMQLAAWIRKSKNGKTFMSIKASEKRDKPHQKPGENVPASDYDSEIPF